MHHLCLPPLSGFPLFWSFSPSSVFGPHLCKHFIANIIWLRREYIHHAFLSFSKVNSLRNMKTCPALPVFMCSGGRVRLKAPSKSSLKVQTTFCLFSEAQNTSHPLSRVRERVLTAGVNEHSEWQDASKCSRKMSELPLTLVIPSHFLLRHPERQPRCLLTTFLVGR